MEGPGAGSPGTKTQGFQFLKGSNVTIKNGTLVARDTDQIKMLVQNYANLTLDNVKLVGSDHTQYVLSNNYGNIILKNGTTITAKEGTVAFDAWYGLNQIYDDPGVFVNLDKTVTINGTVEFGKQARASVENFSTNAGITVPDSMNLDITPSSTQTGGEYQWVDNGNGTKTYKFVIST